MALYLDGTTVLLPNMGSSHVQMITTYLHSEPWSGAARRLTYFNDGSSLGSVLKSDSSVNVFMFVMSDVTMSLSQVPLLCPQPSLFGNDISCVAYRNYLK